MIFAFCTRAAVRDVMDTKEMFAAYKAATQKHLEEENYISNPKTAPTIVEHWKELEHYVPRVGMRHSPASERHLKRVLQHSFSRMSGTLEEANFIGLLCKLAGYTRVVEVGTFLGLTTLIVAEVLGEAGKIVTLDIGEEFLAIAKAGWEDAGVTSRIESRITPGAVGLQALIDEHGAGSFDVVFIDADKPNYDTYYELALKLVRVGGAVLVDNTLWSGKVATHESDESTVTIRALNEKILKDARVEHSLVPFADGVTICRKK
jgi:predicted O-methyltransferase YrrM